MERIPTGIASFDQLLGADKMGSGIAVVAAQVVQVCGEPGSGKSTVLLQSGREWARARHGVLYVACEESTSQIAQRARRVGKFSRTMMIVRARDLETVLNAIAEHRPKIVIVDSVNTIEVEEYAFGSIAAAHVAAREITDLAKEHGIGVFLIVQINKNGTFSGPQAMEHYVDTSLFLRVIGNKKTSRIRVLESIKNRFGEAPLSARFQMTDHGLVEIPDEPEPEEEPEVEPEVVEKPRHLKAVPPAPVKAKTPPKKRKRPTKKPSPEHPAA